MDSKDCIVIWISSIKMYLTEAFLVSLSNKGIYNRAGKDLEKCKDQLQLSLTEDDMLQFIFEDGTIVKLSKKLQESECSCPSQTLCRHIMTALLYCKNCEMAVSKTAVNETSVNETAINEASINEAVINETQINEIPKDENDFYSKELLELEALSKEELVKFFGKKTYNTALKKLQYLKEAAFEYGPMVTVSLGEEGKIYFPRQDTLLQAVCFCKEKGLCEHKLLAVLAYLQQECGQMLTSEEEVFKLEIDAITSLKDIQKEIILLMDKGLCSLTQGSIKKIETLYMKAYGRKFYQLANELKSLSGELGYYFSKNVAFSSQRMLSLVCRINNRIEALILHHEHPEKLMLLAGRLREETVELDTISLIGLGARCTLSKRQDIVLTAYFYCKEQEKILSMSTLRPIEMAYNKSARRGIIQIQEFVSYLFGMNNIWEEEFSFEKFLGAQITVQHGIVTEEKLSSSKKIKGKITGETTLEAIGPLIIKAYDTLKGRLESSDYFMPYRFSKNIYLIEAALVSEMTFNEVEQQLQFETADERGKTILFYLPYNSVTEKAIKYLENKQENIGKHFLGNINWKKDHLEAELLSVFKEGRPINIFTS